MSDEEDTRPVDVILNEIIARDSARAEKKAEMDRNELGQFAKPVNYNEMSRSDFARHLHDTYGVR